MTVFHCSSPIMTIDKSGNPQGAEPTLAETQVSSELVYEGKFLQARRDKVRLPDGSAGLREYVVHPGAVMVVALLDDGQVVLERQYRYPVQRVMIEFPAGKIDAGEDRLVCAKREPLLDLQQAFVAGGRADTHGADLPAEQAPQRTRIAALGLSGRRRGKDQRVVLGVCGRTEIRAVNARYTWHGTEMPPEPQRCIGDQLRRQAGHMRQAANCFGQAAWIDAVVT